MEEGDFEIAQIKKEKWHIGKGFKLIVYILCGLVIIHGLDTIAKNIVWLLSNLHLLKNL